MTFIPASTEIEAILAPVTALPPGLTEKTYVSSVTGTAPAVVPQDNAYARRNLHARLILTGVTAGSLTVAVVGINSVSGTYALSGAGTAITVNGTHHICLGPDFIDSPVVTAPDTVHVIKRMPLPDRFSFLIVHTGLTGHSYSISYTLEP